MAAQTATAFYPRLLVCVSTFLYARYVPAVAIYCEITLQASENNYKSAKLCATFDVMCAAHFTPIAMVQKCNGDICFELIAPWCISHSLCWVETNGINVSLLCRRLLYNT
jgi:hypothetical protein